MGLSAKLFSWSVLLSLGVVCTVVPVHADNSSGGQIIDLFGKIILNEMNRDASRRQQKQQIRKIQITTERREKNRRFVAEGLNSYKTQYTPKYFFVKSAEFYRTAAIRYIKSIGGTVITNGDPFFILTIKETVKKERADYNIQLVATITAIDHNTKYHFSAFHSRFNVQCSRAQSKASCATLVELATDHLLHSFE